MNSLYLGVEIGGTKQQIIVGNENGRIIDRISERIPLNNGASDILAWINVKLPLLREKYADIKAIGVGFGGPLESASGKVLISVQVPGWKDFKLKKWFEDQFSLPTTVVIDSVCGGYAELKLGAGRGAKCLIYSNIGTGIGGALYIGGLTYDGVGNGAMYLGNTFVADWTAKKAGAVEKIENLCCGIAIEKRLRTKGYVPASSLLWQFAEGEQSAMNCRMLGDAARSGDEFALAELDRVGKTYGIGLSTAITFLSPDKVVIGGGVANLGEVLLDPIRRHTEQYVFISSRGTYEIIKSQIMDDNVPVGAVLYARDGFRTI
jgi:glucokinase